MSGCPRKCSQDECTIYTRLISSHIIISLPIMECQLRVHQEMISQEVLLQFLKDYCDRWYAVLEDDASRSHYQCYIQIKSKYKSLNSFRNIFKKVLNSTGNRAYSISELRETSVVLICYLMKEGNLISQVGITPEEISLAESRQAEIQEARQKSAAKKPVSIVAQVLDLLPPRKMSRFEIAPILLKFFLDRKKLVPDQGLFRRYLYTLELARDPAQATEYLRTLFEFECPTLECQDGWSNFFSQDKVSQ